MIELCFSGSSSKFPIFVGALKAFKDLNISISCIAGNSGGALVGGLYASGISVNTIEQLVMNIDFGKFVKFSRLKFLWSIVSGKQYIESGNKLRQFLLDITKNITIKDLTIPCWIIATDMCEDKPFIFSRETTPNIKLADAIMASIAIPGLFKAVEIEDMILYDGGLVADFPINYLPGNDKKIGVIIKSPDICPRNTNITTILADTINILISTNVKNSIEKSDGDETIIEIIDNLGMLEFEVDKLYKSRLIDKGYNAVNASFEKNR